MKEIKLTNNKNKVLVDDDDFKYLNKYNWSTNNTGYAYTTIKQIKTHMPYLIINISKGYEIDHIDRNKLNNQKNNLRVVTKSQNSFNKSIRKGCTSEYKGVSKRKDMNYWRARIVFNYKEIHLGYFENEIDAAKAYNEKAIELFGEFAVLNEVKK